jgi:thiol-disulfide isomerase/thioredoxin
MNESPETLPTPTMPSRRKPFLWGCLAGVLGTILGLVLLMAGIVALTYVKPVQDFWVAKKRAQLKTVAPGAGLTGDYSLNLEQVDGAPLAMESLKKRTVFLHFWSPSCINCLPELAGLNKLHKSLAGSDVAFVAVAIAGFDDLQKVAKENGVNFPLYICRGALPELYQGGAPITVILSPSGDVVLRHKGSAKWDSPAVTALLKGLSAFAPQSTTG